MGIIDAAQVHITRTKIRDESQEVLFNDMPIFFNEQPIEAIRSRGMVFGEGFDNMFYLLSSEILIHIIEGMLMNQTY